MISGTELRQLVRAVGPILSRAIRSGQMLRPQCVLTEPDPDILAEYDCASRSRTEPT
jgi:hypothetical protein